jgi:hypothetical protein
MKSKANALRLEEREEETELEALLNLIRKQAELDKKLRALIVVATTAVAGD